MRAPTAVGNSAYTSQAHATTNRTPSAPADLAATAIFRVPDQPELDRPVDQRDRLQDRAEAGKHRHLAADRRRRRRVTSYRNTGGRVGTTYYYRVRAYNSVGDSAYTNQVSTTTLKTPDAPANLSVTAASTTQMNLSWLDHSSNETGFKIERKLGSTGAWSQIATVGAGVTSYENTGLTAGKFYYYRVRATNSYRNSAYSNQAFAPTLSAAQVAFAAAPAGTAGRMQPSLRATPTWLKSHGGVAVRRHRPRSSPKPGAGGSARRIDCRRPLHADDTHHSPSGLRRTGCSYILMYAKLDE